MSGQLQQLSDDPKIQKRELKIEYLRQLKRRKDLQKDGNREDGYNRTNDGMTNHERVLHQRRFRNKGSR